MEPKIAFDGQTRRHVATLTITDTKDDGLGARLLYGAAPECERPTRGPEFADWLTANRTTRTSPSVIANRDLGQSSPASAWSIPVDDWGPHNKPSAPRPARPTSPKPTPKAGFDAKFLARAITASEAYQRTSQQTDPRQADPRLLARMNVKGLSAEQLFDSLALATGYRDPVPLAARTVGGWPAASPRGQYLAKFGGGSARTDMQVSILQALALMNGEWTTRQTDPARGEALKAVVDAPFLTAGDRVEVLFLSTLSRRPTDAERSRYRESVAAAPDPARGLSDVLWALVNSQEFLVNN